MPGESDSTPAPRQPKTMRCAYCGKRFQFTTMAAHKTFPFCSARCREADLGNWLSDRYSAPGQPLPPEEPEEC